MKDEHHSISHWLFLRCLGLIYFAAFVSLGMQVLGLIGSNGILPAGAFLSEAHKQFGPAGFWLLPTLVWISSSDFFLQTLCWGGAFLSVVLITGIFEAPVLFLLWLFYLSLAVVSREFLGYQWDILLLETGFLSMFSARFFRKRLLSLGSEPPKFILWLFYWLLFRLVFSSGAVKLSSGDPTWWNLTALNYHYETQPLPTWAAWYAHHLPEWAQKFSVVCMFAGELLIPFFIFAPGRLKLIAFFGITVFQLLIVATGNYCFFNFLAIALCLFLIDDSVWFGWFKVCHSEKSHRDNEESKTLDPSLPSTTTASLHSATQDDTDWKWPAWVIYSVSGLLLMLSTMQFTWAFRVRVNWPMPLTVLDRIFEPFRLANPYGLFAVMTISRPEIIIEGSNNKEYWYAYEFKYKPGDLKRRPRFNIPHQPRLDWQMWFAALGDYRYQPWFGSFLLRLLQGSPEVLRLLEYNPFPGRPPRYIRAVVYDYHFSDFETKRTKGEWWRRNVKGLYAPVASLKESS